MSKNVKEFGAIGDGLEHPLSGRFATLGEAKAVFPFVTTLDQSIDWAAIQAAISASGTPDDPRGSTVLIPRGVYVCSDDLRISRQLRLTGEGRGVSAVRFSAGKGVIVDSKLTSLDGGEATYSTIADVISLGHGSRASPSGSRVIHTEGEQRYGRLTITAFTTSGLPATNR